MSTIDETGIPVVIEAPAIGSDPETDEPAPPEPEPEPEPEGGDEA